jgi:serine/threonine-protein kinase
VVSEAPRGIVINQDPVAGTKVKEGAVVSLSVSEGPGSKQVPVVDDLGRHAARRKLTAAGFEVDEREQESEDVPHGHVIRTSPSGGDQLELGSTVVMFVSTGPPAVDLPSVVGDKVDDARATLEDAGFKVTIEHRASTDKDPGTVLSQAPAPGGQAPKGSAVTLVVAQAPDKVPVPDVVGFSQARAVRVLSGAGFEVNTQSASTPDEAKDGRVISQDPGGTDKAKPGSEVTIVVGSFQAPPDQGATTPAPAPGAR